MRLLLRALVASVLAVAVAQPAFAQPESAPAAGHREPSAGDLATARSALREGLSLREGGDLKGAIARLQTAYDLVQTPVTAFELGKAHLMAGHVLQAHELFMKIGRMPLAVEESERSVVARSEAARLGAELEPRIPQLRIRLTLPEGASAVVRIDDEEIPITGAVTPRAVEPGRHEVAAKAGDGPEQVIEVSVAEGEKKDVELAPEWVPPKPPPPPSSQALYVRRTNPLVFVGFGGASASLVVTVTAAVLAADASSRMRDRCGTEFCPESVRLNEGAERGLWSATAFIAGASTVAFLAMGIITISRPVKERVTAGVRPYVGVLGGGLEGRF